MGAIVDRTQLDRVLGYIETGQSEGAELHLGGHRAREESGGYFVEPTIFDAVSNCTSSRARSARVWPGSTASTAANDLDSRRLTEKRAHGLEVLRRRVAAP